MERTGQEALGGSDDQDGRAQKVDLHQGGREVGEVLRVAHRGLGHHGDEKDATRPAYPFGDVGHVEPDHEADGEADEEHHQARVQLGQIA